MAGEEILFGSGQNLAAGTLGGFLAGVAVAAIIIAVLVIIAIYVYHALAWYRIGRIQKYKYPWLAWIPFANVAMIFEMGGFHWAWVFLLLVPVLGWVAVIVLLTISLWRIFEKSKYPGWLSISYPLTIVPTIGIFAFVAYLIIIGLCAWKPKVKSKRKAKK